MLYLASRSPRRNELLARLERPFQALELDVPEVRAPDESAHDPEAVVLGSDTEVVLDGRVFGKPADAADACAMLRALAGRTHQVMTAVALVAAGREQGVLVVSEVTFAAIDEDRIAAYVASGEPMDKAGAYAIQGGAERYIRHLAGSYSGVMGLPLQQTEQLLQTFELKGVAHV
jgi:septum formation protein